MLEDYEIIDLLHSGGLPAKRCGLNADWSVQAWYLSAGTPNITSGDHYLLETEKEDEHGTPLFEIVERDYRNNDEDQIKVIVKAGPLPNVLLAYVGRRL